MRKDIGPLLVFDTNPPYRQWDGNQATILFFPIFTAFVLTLLSGLSEPIIGGLNMAQVEGLNGTVSFGTWGFCVKGSPGTNDFCSGNRGFGGNLTDLEMIPESLATMRDVVHVLPGSYLIATGVFHMLGALTTWLTLTWTLAASGAWQDQDPNGWNWTRFSFHGTGVSSVFVLIGWGLDIGIFTRVQSKAVNVDGSQPKVIPGPAIWMMMIAFILCFFTYLTRIFYSRWFPRPQWSIKGSSDFHTNPQSPTLPLSAALPAPVDHPPRWEDLNLQTPSFGRGVDGAGFGYSAEEEKAVLERMESEGLSQMTTQDYSKPFVERHNF